MKKYISPSVQTIEIESDSIMDVILPTSIIPQCDDEEYNEEEFTLNSASYRSTLWN